MSKFNLSFVSNAAFVILLSFIACYCVTIYYVRAIIPTFVVSISFSMIATCIYVLIFKRISETKFIKRKDEILFDKFRYALSLTPETQYGEYAERILKENNIPFSKCDETIFINEKKSVFTFKFPALNENDILKILRENKKPIALFCIALDENARILASGYCDIIEVFELTDIFLYIKNDEILLSNAIVPQTKKSKFVDLLKKTFNPSYAKRFAFYGILTLITSRFVFYPLLYIITGCLFVAYALITIFFAPKNSKR